LPVYRCSGARSRREAAWLPPWRDLLRVYRRLASRGEIRGGRFVAGFSGEQLALPEAVAMLRKVRREQGDGEWVSISGADPLNLAGIVTPGPRLPALAGNRPLYRDGLPVATLTGARRGVSPIPRRCHRIGGEQCLAATRRNRALAFSGLRFGSRRR